MTTGPRGDETDPSGESDAHPRGKPRLRLTFRSDVMGRPFRERFDGDVSIEIDTVVDLPNGGHLEYWTTTACSPDELLAAATEFPATADARLLSTVGDEHRLEVRGKPESLHGVFKRFGGVTRSSVYEDRRVRLVADFPPTVDVDALVDAVTDLYPDLELVSSQEVRTASVVRSMLDERLTERQSTVLRMAYYGGYFERPRESTGAELADRLDISRQAFHEHLRKAYAAVFEQLFEGGDAVGVDW
jgi:DNA-binding CsgD family transcriptional regulator